MTTKSHQNGCTTILAIAAVLIIIGMLAGCSATTLRCGIQAEDSYVELINVPQDITGQARNFKDLCGFAYEVEPVKLNIIGAQ